MAEADTDLGYTLAVDTMAEPAETMTPMPGLVLKDRYLLIKEIGRGGQSLVFKARDLVAAKAGLSKADVALKIITAGPEIEPDFVALMHREARRLRDLVHPNIVRVYDMDRVQNLHFMVMEYLEGDTLSSFLRKAEDRKLELAQVIRLVQDLGSALEFAHANGIIHSDLKPGNVFVQTDGSVKLIDFNISAPIAPSLRKDEEDTIRILIRLGAITPSYASPQRLEGHEPCAADDVFSLAVMVYLCLAGRRPFGPKNALEAMEASVQPERPEHLSSAQWTALMKGLAFDDAGRTPEVTNFVTSFAAQRQSAADWIRSQLSW
ncbi:MULTISPECIES: serine/threonine-protein kinase [unclassified Roseibium]|uniref:serine/threonine-protein kinase n=1 Tax=unclassified Roseibium TaxID=2629323 RepID=UPI00273FBCA8|nr:MULTISPECIES: serine/threonine-protein kinase [unclassified Roseibium]